MTRTIPPANERSGVAVLGLTLGLSTVLLFLGDFIPLLLVGVALAAWSKGLRFGLATTALGLVLGLGAASKQPTPEAVTVATGHVINFGVVGLFISGLTVALNTARRRAEAETRAVRLSEERNALAALGSRDALWDWDLRSGGIYHSQRMEELVGPAAEGPQDVMGDFAARLHPEDRDRALTALRDHLERRRAYNVEFRLRTAMGEYRWFQAYGQATWDEQGRATRMAGSLGDITARKQAEDQLRAAKEVAEAAGRSKDLFLAMLSHELRTPLTPALLGISGVLDDPATPDDLRPTLEAARRGVELEARLVDDLLDVTRIGSGKLRIVRERIDADVLIRRALSACVGELAAAGLHLELDLATDGQYLEADPARLQQVVWNLVKNAVKFTRPGGTIAVRSRNVPDCACREGGSCLLIEVADTGAGIEAELLPRLFEAFEQGGEMRQRRSGGLGLGLAISRAIAEAHGGRLTARSEGSGRGATFTLELPAARDVARPVSVPSAAGIPCAIRTMRVLVVEDDEETRRVLARLLQRRGAEVTTAGSLAEAQRAASAISFDLLISDLGLPDGTGLDLVRWLSTRSRVPAIALTGYGMEEDERRCRAAGFAEHLIKPIDLERLEGAIRRVLPAFG